MIGAIWNGITSPTRIVRDPVEEIYFFINVPIYILLTSIFIETSWFNKLEKKKNIIYFHSNKYIYNIYTNYIYIYNLCWWIEWNPTINDYNHYRPIAYWQAYNSFTWNGKTMVWLCKGNHIQPIKLYMLIISIIRFVYMRMHII